MSLLAKLPEAERLQWKLALLQHRPADLPGRHMANVALGYMAQQTLGGDLVMPAHWEQAVLAWRRRGFTPASFLVLHQAVDELARLGYQMPVPPPGPPTPPERPTPPGPSTPPGPPAPRPTGSPAPARRTPRGYRSWGGRPGLGHHALDPEEWAGRGDWVGSAIRDIVMDVLQARDQAASVRLAETTPETDPAATPDIGQAARSDGGPGAHLPETR